MFKTITFHLNPMNQDALDTISLALYQALGDRYTMNAVPGDADARCFHIEAQYEADAVRIVGDNGGTGITVCELNESHAR